MSEEKKLDGGASDEEDFFITIEHAQDLASARRRIVPKTIPYGVLISAHGKNQKGFVGLLEVERNVTRVGIVRGVKVEKVEKVTEVVFQTPMRSTLKECEFDLNVVQRMARNVLAEHAPAENKVVLS